MKRIYAAVLLSALVAPRMASAQENVGGTPYGLRTAMDRTVIPTVQAAYFDAQAVAQEDAQREHDRKLPFYGRLLGVNANMLNSGIWATLPNGDRVWRLRIASHGALANELYYRDFFLPNGALLYIYDDQGGQTLGGFTTYNNTPTGLFSTAQIDGDACILEYYEPLAVSGEGHFTVASVGHAYRWAGQEKAADCEVDVNCSPEGDGWAGQRDGVVRVGVVEGGGAGWCSGSLVNNVTQDCKPYFLTANHCGPDVTSTELAQWKFYFKYQRTGCGTGSASTAKVMTGCVQRGTSHDNGGDNGSDFLLMEANNPVPASYTPFWMGWDATTTTHTGGKGIHHPNGDEKKISTYTGNAQNSSAWNGMSTHYRVIWTATTNGHGVTEPGSSGSPLFDNAHHVIGTLTGGGSFCESQQAGGENQPDYYGRVNYHWASNGAPETEQLKHWLDPDNTGTMVMEGSYGPCGTLGVQDATIDMPTISPNPAIDHVRIQLPAGVEHADRIEVLDLAGRLVSSVVPAAMRSTDVDLSGLNAGTYLVRVIAGDVHYAAVKVEVMGR